VCPLRKPGRKVTKETVKELDVSFCKVLWGREIGAGGRTNVCAVQSGSIFKDLGFRACVPQDLMGGGVAPVLFDPAPPLLVPKVFLGEDGFLHLAVGADEVTVLSCSTVDNFRPGRVGPSVLVSGRLAGVSVLILLDSGAQTNLVSRSFLEAHPHLQLSTNSGNLQLRFGDNNQASTLGEFRNVQLDVQGDVLRVPVVSVSPFSMVGCDLILGTPFLQQTGGGVFCDPKPRM
jgi:hypothetical protein